MFRKIVLLWALATFCLFAQNTGGLRGVITDQSGALVPGVEIVITSESGVATRITSGPDGSYTAGGLAPGSYSVKASTAGLSQPNAATVTIGSGTSTLNIQMQLVLAGQQVTVQDTAEVTVDTDPNQSAAAMVVSGDNLDSLSDDPDDLEADLEALAGPAAGTGGAQFYIDGFTAGDAPLPAKSAIREIRVNQNPFSPEYDAIGFGRTEILTKPGSDKYRGQAYLNYGNDLFNSRNPYAEAKAPLNLWEPGGSFGGPMNKNSSFFVDVSDRHIANGSIVDAITVNPATYAITPFTAVVTGPARRFRISPRIDYQFGKNHTLTFRYALTNTTSAENGTGGFNLASRGYDQFLREHAFQATETWLVAPNIVDESHFQFLHQHQTQNSPDTDPSVIVDGAFYGGGPANNSYYYFHHHYEVSNYVSIVHGQHSIKTGVRLRAVAIWDSSRASFDGTWVFSSIQQYAAALQLNAIGQLAPATQYSVNVGNPLVLVGQIDIAGFVGDDWRIRPNLTFSYGLRYENQTNIHDPGDFAPRLALAWAPGKAAKGGRQKTVIRLGSGVFYNRFNEQNVLIAERFNGVSQQQFIQVDPTTFPRAPVFTAPTTQAVHTLDSDLKAPFVIQTAAGVERQLPRNTTLAITYTNSHADHQYDSRNINAPLPGTFAAGNPVYPFPGQGPILQMETAGLYNQNQLVTNINTRITKNTSLFGYYMLNSAHSNADSINTYPANEYSPAGEYARASTDIRHRATIGGSITTLWDIRLSPLATLQSGAPFNITIPTDIYGDTIADARPGIATNPNLPGLIQTSYGLLDPNPKPGEAILPRNAGNGPGLYSVDLRLSKTFYFRKNAERTASSTGRVSAAPAAGPAGRGGIGGFEGQATAVGEAGGGRNYNLTFSVSARNLFNHTNPGGIIGVLGSPLFGQSNQIAGGFGAFSGNASNRRLEFQARFAF
ncbi:MAG TPA: carboxypeptidase-like regulatory domain-containing protein [Bryobacteraceae bacterium]|nr:carboxypeptidase-like regulatory domain-containing protein [Bryobacteraceae bacterium]